MLFCLSFDSAGVGRTGTFIALDTLMSQMESSDEVDIFGLIRSMRMNRCLMVQTEVRSCYGNMADILSQVKPLKIKSLYPNRITIYSRFR